MGVFLGGSSTVLLVFCIRVFGSLTEFPSPVTTLYNDSLVHPISDCLYITNIIKTRITTGVVFDKTTSPVLLLHKHYPTPLLLFTSLSFTPGESSKRYFLSFYSMTL